MKGAEILVKALEEEGVRYVFSIPGNHTLSVHDALNKSSIKSIIPTHEPAVGFMADVYGRITREPGVALLTVGPGALNTVNPVAQAYVESSPIVVIASQCDSSKWGKGLYHEMEHPEVQTEIFKEITKWQTRINSADEISEKITNAFYHAKNGRPRPVYVEIPENIFIQETEYVPHQRKEVPKKEAKRSEINEVINILLEAESPVIYAGGGVKSSNASQELIELAELLEIPVATSLMGKGVIPEDHKLSLGCGAGRLGNKAAVHLVTNADVMLAIGTRFNEVGTGFFTLDIPPNLVHIDIDEKEINKNYQATLGIVGDAKIVLRQLLDGLSKRKITKKREDIQRKIAEIKARERAEIQKDLSDKSELIDPINIMYDLAKLVTGESIIIADSGNSFLWVLEYPILKTQSIFIPAGYNSMGFSIPGAISAKLALPSKTVIGICGDGSFLMTGMEFLTAVRYNIDIKIIVLHDNRYNILSFFQDLKYGGRYVDTLLNTFNFAKFANDLGGFGIEITNSKELKKSLKMGLDHKGPTLFDVYVDPKKQPIISRRLLAVLTATRLKDQND